VDGTQGYYLRKAWCIDGTVWYEERFYPMGYLQSSYRRCTICFVWTRLVGRIW
jgi:hypothetical protein